VHGKRRFRGGTYNDAVSSDFDVVPDSRCLHHGVCADVNVIAYFHWVVVEVPAIRFIRRPVSKHELCVKRVEVLEDMHTSSRSPRQPSNIFQAR
jgi:hypothetical protein